jgi:hypothetical protein
MVNNTTLINRLLMCIRVRAWYSHAGSIVCVTILDMLLFEYIGIQEDGLIIHSMITLMLEYFRLKYRLHLLCKLVKRKRPNSFPMQWGLKLIRICKWKQMNNIRSWHLFRYIFGSLMSRDNTFQLLVCETFLIQIHTKHTGNILRALQYNRREQQNTST